MSAVEAALPFEHFHRYTYASELLRGKRVLDLASREGYGARLIAETAESVVAMDADEAVVREAAQTHQLANLTFVAGRALSVPPGDSFDAIVCFDAIEDAMEPARLIVDIKRALAPGGLLILSAPHENVRESLFPAKRFNAEDFFRLAKSHFANAEELVQTINGASVIERFAGKKNTTSENCPQYLITIASDGTIPRLEPSTMQMPGISLLRDKERTIRELLDIRAYFAETVKRQEQQIADHKRTIASLEEAFAWHKSQIASTDKAREYLQHEVDELRQSVDSDRKALDWRTAQVRGMEEAIGEKDRALEWRATQVQEKDSEIAALKKAHGEVSRSLARASEELELIHSSTGWKFVLRMRSIRSRLMPDGSARYRLCKRIMRMVSGG
jgi:2-polyprenyl-3-methyl-5-hydroxy-6-metoxy-1,4-benzoquinol methylase